MLCLLGLSLGCWQYSLTSVLTTTTDQTLLSAGNSSIDYAIQSLVGSPLANWDAIYFVRIAEVGKYEYEHIQAFLPLLSYTIRIVSTLFEFIGGGEISQHSATLLAGVLVCQACFLLSVIELYRLGCLVLQDSSLAFKAAVLYCFTPAGIFITAMYVFRVLLETVGNFASSYTESMYALFTLLALRLYHEDKRWLAALSLACASGVRSNAFLICLVFGLRTLRSVALYIRVRPGIGLLRMAELVVQSIVSVSPFVYYLYSAYTNYCVEHDGLPAGYTPPSWCNAKMPNIYNHVQATYWNVGPFRYYELKQLPNFLLASPMIALSIAGIVSYARYSKLGSKQSLQGYYAAAVFPFIALWAVLLAIAVVVTHVQIITRFFSSLPPVYWFAATLFPTDPSRVRPTWKQRALLFYFLFYTVAGAMLFSNFLPWT